MTITCFNQESAKISSMVREGAFVLSALGLIGLCFIPARTVVADHNGEAPDTISLTGIVRDFKERTVPGGHPDFERQPAHGFGHYAGNVELQLGVDGKPVFITQGIGHKITTQAKDKDGYEIAPHLANKAVSQPLYHFDINGGTVVPGEEYAAEVTVLGAAITYGGKYDIPVTLEIKIDGKKFEPFGKFNKALGGNINDGSGPRQFVAPKLYKADSKITVAGQAWVKKDSNKKSYKDGDWKKHMKVDSKTNSPNVLTLRNGDSVPNVPAFMDQDSIVDFIQDYIDTETNLVTLHDNQAIYLFELGMTDLSSPAADFQDLVVLVSLANSLEYFTEGEGVEIDEKYGDKKAKEGQPDHGALTSSDNFNQWYRDVLGINISKPLTLTLLRQDDGTYVFDDREDPLYYERGGFFPIDDDLFGNSGGSPDHNFHFTFELHGEFTYDDSASQMFRFVGDDDVWVFINGQLVIDLGGVHSAIEQFIDLDRLGLQDGMVYQLDFFFAERHRTQSNFRITTNLPLQTIAIPSITAAFD